MKRHYNLFINEMLGLYLVPHLQLRRSRGLNCATNIRHR